MPDDPGNLNYSEAVAAGLYGDQDPHADAALGLTAEDVGGPAAEPGLGRTQHDGWVGRGKR